MFRIERSCHRLLFGFFAKIGSGSRFTSWFPTHLTATKALAAKATLHNPSISLHNPSTSVHNPSNTHALEASFPPHPLVPHPKTTVTDSALRRGAGGFNPLTNRKQNNGL
jgi:hypothetical protein